MQILISGGANSGKSSLAEQLAVAQSFQPRYYFATMQVWDAECARRIERHRQQRAGKDFQTVEVPTNLLETISTLPQGGCGLLECVSNLLSNEQFGGSQEDPVTAILDGMAALQKKLDAVVIVTNEVFTDRVPNDIAMRQYLQNLGNINQVLASRSDVVIEVCSGIPLCWKGASLFHEIML